MKTHVVTPAAIQAHILQVTPYRPRKMSYWIAVPMWIVLSALAWAAIIKGVILAVEAG